MTTIRFMRTAEVEFLTGLSRRNLIRKASAGTFPPRRLLSTRRYGWVAHEVEAWQAARLRQIS